MNACRAVPSSSRDVPVARSSGKAERAGAAILYTVVHQDARGVTAARASERQLSQFIDW
jgi:hypothetical protein